MQADAAMMIMRDYLSGLSRNGANDDELATTSTADQYQVVVHVDEQALVNGESTDRGTDHGEALSKGASELPISTVRRLCCDGSIIPIIENAKGEPLNVGRKTRILTTAIRRALWARDKGCVFPGCHCKRYVDGHHIKHWADGGETGLNNLVLLCTRHHRLVHEGGYKIEFNQAKQRLFRRPDGKAVPECGYRLDDYNDITNVRLSDIF